MFKFKPQILYSLMLLCSTQLNAQKTVDTSHVFYKAVAPVTNPVLKSKSFPIRSFIIPAALISYGGFSLESDALKDINEDVKEEIYTESPHKKISIDNYLQFAPAAAVYGLNAIGIKGKHNLKDGTIIYLMSNLIANVSSISIKQLSHQIRPDGSAYTSFPSGHTTEAFVSAEFLRQEYQDVSPWIGIAGYGVAAATGYLRMYNNKHWLSDIVAGAGIGIASVKVSMWLYPKIQQVFSHHKNVNNIIMPTYSDKTFGLGIVHKF